MKRTIQFIAVLGMAATLLSFAPPAKEKTKKLSTFNVKRVLPFSADKVWQAVAEDYGAIANMHPKIVSSSYIGGSLKGGEGVERICHFNEKGTQYLKEKMLDYNPGQMQFTNQVFQAGKFPLDPEVTRAVYTVKVLSDNSCELSFNMQYRTKPAMMGGMMRGKFRGLINDYLLSIEHHLATGEKVTKENFKRIKKQYSKSEKAQNNAQMMSLINN